ncbi:preprotein translocase subunit SecE [Sodalis-like secondary symbiont of Drepanosiphum platanoidis]|uniref:preprotein translocase subunit SecE n=1 Tax=Sodalis-like secondary symbiont of Drepanosiphum platanoidis TaxID=2994493 RepID=UPI0034638EB3
MNFKYKKKEKNIDIIKLIFIIIFNICIATICKIKEINFILQFITIISIFFIELYIFIKTFYGKIFISFVHKSLIETKKIIWPSSRDTLNTTIVIFIVTLLVSIILWILDTILIYIISIIIQLRF